MEPTLTVKNIDKKKEFFSIPLFSQVPKIDGKKLPIDTEEGHVLNSKSGYEFFLNGAEDGEVRILINNTEPTNSDLNKDRVWEISAGVIYVGQIFDDVWGLAQIHITLNPGTERATELYSEFIRVQTEKTEADDFIRMAEYVYQNIPTLLVANGPLRSKIETDLRRLSLSMLDLRLRLIERTIRTYQKSSSYFRISARVRTEKEYVVDEATKLQQLSTESILFAVQHPDQMMPAVGAHGIPVGRKYYLPRKILMTRNALSKDTYENRTILGFLRLLLNELGMIEARIKATLDAGDKDGYYLFSETGELLPPDFLKEKQQEIPRLKKKLQSLLLTYQDIFQIPVPTFISCPHPTAIFCAEPQYREIYELISAWYRGVYDFTQTQFILQCIGSSRLYESFVLICFYQYFKKNEYKITSGNAKEESSKRIHDKYTFEKGGETVTLYYEPDIIDQSDDTGLRTPGHYTPDYVLKFEKPGVDTKYVICDAKFSTYDTTRIDRYPDVFEKYNRIENPATKGIPPICVIYGEYSDDDPKRVEFGETIFKCNGTEEHRSNGMIIPMAVKFLQSGSDRTIEENIDRIIGLKRA